MLDAVKGQNQRRKLLSCAPLLSVSQSNPKPRKYHISLNQQLSENTLYLRRVDVLLRPILEVAQFFGPSNPNHPFHNRNHVLVTQARDNSSYLSSHTSCNKQSHPHSFFYTLPRHELAIDLPPGFRSDVALGTSGVTAAKRTPCRTAVGGTSSEPIFTRLGDNMATTVSPTTVERSGSRRISSHSTPSRSQSSRVKSAVSPEPGRTNSTHRRRASRVEEVLPQLDYETSNVAAQTSRTSSHKDRPLPNRAESGRSASGHHHRSSSRYNSDMATTVANSGGPAPIVQPSESRHRSSGKSRTTIPAQTGNWVLGKTIGAGSMGKVKLARRVEGGEQVKINIVRGLRAWLIV